MRVVYCFTRLYRKHSKANKSVVLYFRNQSFGIDFHQTYLGVK